MRIDMDARGTVTMVVVGIAMRMEDEQVEIVTEQQEQEVTTVAIRGTETVVMVASREQMTTEIVEEVHGVASTIETEPSSETVEEEEEEEEEGEIMTLRVRGTTAARIHAATMITNDTLTKASETHIASVIVAANVIVTWRWSGIETETGTEHRGTIATCAPIDRWAMWRRRGAETKMRRTRRQNHLHM